VKPYQLTSVIIILVILLTGCSPKKEIRFSGKTMDTIYHIKIVAWFFKDTKGLKDQIEKRLEEINRSMSIYKADSEISRFNAEKSTDKKFYVSNDFLNVMTIAENIYKLSNGAWDGTIKPLVNLWGFNSPAIIRIIPKKEKIKNLLTDLGFNKIEILENRYFRKKNPSISLDLSSVAKGYAVDQVAKIIKIHEIENFLVEIGGEVYASGFKKDGRHWKVGINTPKKDAPYNHLYKVISLSNKAVATSGDYRKFFEIEGKRYSHVIDPRTGYPVANGIISVSIMADTCTFADGLATAIMVLGHEKGLDLVGRLDNVECLIVVEKKDGNIVDYCSKGFKDK